MNSQEDTAVINNRTPLPTEDQVEEEARSGTGLFKYIRLAKAERSQFFLTATMFFNITFIYSFSRILKDYYINEKQLPASINFIKVFLILPFSFLFVGLIQRALQSYSVSRILDVAILSFVAVFLSFGFFFFPWANLIQLDFFFSRKIFADEKMSFRGLDSFFAIFLVFNDWTSSLFYTIAELWGSIVLSFLFLSFSNDIYTAKQNARFIPLFYIGSNISLFVSGVVTDFITKWAENADYDTVLSVYNAFFVVGAALTASVYGLKWYLEKKVLCNPIFVKTDLAKPKKKAKVGFVEGLKAMAQSKLLIAISCTVLFYNISTNILESAVKSGVSLGAKEENTNKGTYSSKLFSKEQMFVALSVIVILVSPFVEFIQTKGWIVVAIVPPIITIVSLLIVFGLATYNYAAKNSDALFIGDYLFNSKSYIRWENYLGVFCVGCMKIGKYACFDVAKEAIAMKIDPSYRAKFKAIFDGLCGKLGKSMGAMYGSIIFWALDCRDIRKAALISSFVVLTFSVIWVKSVFYLNRKYNEAVKSNSCVDVDLFSGKKDFE